MDYVFNLNGENANEKFGAGVDASDVLGLWHPEKKEREVELTFCFNRETAMEDYKSFHTEIYNKDVLISFLDNKSYRLRYNHAKSPCVYDDYVKFSVRFNLLG